MSDYCEIDFPWTLYFQGVAMPKWSNCWHFIPVADSHVDWFVDEVHGKMDHAGSLESHDSGVFTIAAQQTLLCAINQRDAIIADLPDLSDPPALIFDNLIAGICSMIKISDQAEVVFWTSGYAADQEMIQQSLRRFELGPTHPDYLNPPHRVRRAQEIRSYTSSQRIELRRKLQTSGLGKDLKRFIHNLPPLTGPSPHSRPAPFR